MYWDDDRSLYLVKTVSAVKELHLRSFYTPIFVSDRPVPYLMRAFSQKALTLSYAWDIANHVCAICHTTWNKAKH